METDKRVENNCQLVSSPNGNNEKKTQSSSDGYLMGKIM
jgi:hypothetical protein